VCAEDMQLRCGAVRADAHAARRANQKLVARGGSEIGGSAVGPDERALMAGLGLSSSRKAVVSRSDVVKAAWHSRTLAAAGVALAAAHRRGVAAGAVASAAAHRRVIAAAGVGAATAHRRDTAAAD